MKTQLAFKIVVAPILGLWVAIATNAVAQSYKIGWSTIDGGGGSSSGAGIFGAFAVVGTVGQPDAGPALAGSGASGSYRITGGFWSFLGNGAFPAPALRISLSGTSAVLSWPNPSTGFQLQECPVLGGPANSWSDVQQTPTIHGADQRVTVPAASASRFYRLRKP
jgi:hypothetical protein